MRNEYFIEISCKIGKLLWMFCKSDGVNSGGATLGPKGAQPPPKYLKKLVYVYIYIYIQQNYFNKEMLYSQYFYNKF